MQVVAMLLGNEVGEYGMNGLWCLVQMVGLAYREGKPASPSRESLVYTHVDR